MKRPQEEREDHTLPKQNLESNPSPDNISHETQTDVTANNDPGAPTAIKKCVISCT